MKNVIVISILALSFAAQANDIQLSSGESIDLYGTTVSCNVKQSNQTYFCTIESTFDGDFSGEGRTRLEAEANAKEACKNGSRSNGFHCDDSSLKCERSN